MHGDHLDENERSPLDFGHFALGSIGFMAAVAGIVIVNAPIALVGVVLFLWSAAYYCAQPD